MDVKASGSTSEPRRKQTNLRWKFEIEIWENKDKPSGSSPDRSSSAVKKYCRNFMRDPETPLPASCWNCNKNSGRSEKDATELENTSLCQKMNFPIHSSLPLLPLFLSPWPRPSSIVLILIDSVLPARTNTNEITAQPRWRTAKRTAALKCGWMTDASPPDFPFGEGKVGGATWTHTAFRDDGVGGEGWNRSVGIYSITGGRQEGTRRGRGAEQVRRRGGGEGGFLN